MKIPVGHRKQGSAFVCLRLYTNRRSKRAGKYFTHIFDIVILPDMKYSNVLKFGVFRRKLLKREGEPVCMQEISERGSVCSPKKQKQKQTNKQTKSGRGRGGGGGGGNWGDTSWISCRVTERRSPSGRRLEPYLIPCLHQ